MPKKKTAGSLLKLAKDKIRFDLKLWKGHSDARI